MLKNMIVAASVALAVVQTGLFERQAVAQVASYGSFQGTGFGGELYPFDGPEPWLHGYFQEIPAYGGYVAFRPYNYKHVLSQSQAAGGWGLPTTMPYSQQFWHRYHSRATMSPVMPYDGSMGMQHGPVQGIGHYEQVLPQSYARPVNPVQHYRR